MDGNDVTVLDPQVVTDDSVDPDTTIIQLIICENDQDGVLSLLASDQDGITTEKLKSVHSIVGQGDDGVIIINGISNPECSSVSVSHEASGRLLSCIHQLVGLLLLLQDGRCGVIFFLALGARSVPTQESVSHDSACDSGVVCCLQQVGLLLLRVIRRRLRCHLCCLL